MQYISFQAGFWAFSSVMLTLALLKVLTALCIASNPVIDEKQYHCFTSARKARPYEFSLKWEPAISIDCIYELFRI